MKKLCMLLAIVLTVGLCNSLTLAADEPAVSEKSKQANWDALFGDEGHKGDGHKRRGHGGHRGEGFGGGSRRGHGGQGFGGGGHRSGGQSFGGGGRGGSGHGVSPQELMSFLKEHEPELASKLETLREESPQDMRRQVRQLSQLYAPVIRSMEHDPEMGTLSLKKVHAQMKIKNLVRNSKKKGGAAIKASELKGHVSALFDATIAEEKLRFEKMSSRMKQWADGDDKRKKKGQGKKSGKGKKGEGRKGQGRSGRGRSHGGDPTKRLEEHKATIESWEDNKATIVDQQVERLMGSSAKPFPWGRM